MKEPWYAKDGLRFQCQANCAQCCSGHPDAAVFVTEREVRRLAKFLKWTVAQVKRHLTHLEFGRRSLRSGPDGACCFLRDKKCSVYAARPAQCRSFPFWQTVLESPATWAEESERCPGIGQGGLIPVGEIKLRARGG